MEVNSSCFFLAPQYRRPVILTATALAVSAILVGIGLYLIKVSSPVIAYSTLGTGGVVGILGLIYFAVSICKKKPLPSPPKPVKEEQLEPKKESVIEREELILYDSYLYNPDRNQLLNFCLKEEEAKKLLQEKGERAGDYVLICPEAQHFTIFYLNEKLDICEQKISDPTIWHGLIYSPVYEKIHYPILPTDSNQNPSVIHSSLMGYRYLAFLKMMDGSGNKNLSGIGSIQNFFNWLRGSPLEKKYRFDPFYLFKIAGHIFGLLGEYTYTYRGANMGAEIACKVNFEGFDRETGRHVIMQDILNYLSSSKLDEEKRDKIELMCRNAYAVDGKENPSSAELLKQLNNGNPITILTGWEGHAVNLTMTRDYLIYINKGDGCGQKPGMHFYEITKEVTIGTLEQLLSRKEKTFFPIDNKASALVELLGLRYKRTIASKYQKTGCCVFASNFPSFKAAMILLGVNDQKAEEEYKACKNKAKLYWLQNVFCLIDKEEADDNLKTELYFFMLYLTLKLKYKKIYRKSISKCENEILCKIKSKIEMLLETEKHLYLEELDTHLKNLCYCKFTKLEEKHQEILKEADGLYSSFYSSLSSAPKNPVIYGRDVRRKRLSFS